MVDVFLSYRRESGSEFASFLKLELSRLGYDVFFDAASLREGDFEINIDKAIDECTYFLLLLAPGDLNRCLVNPDEDWIIHEAQRALKNGKIIIPVCIKAGFVFPAHSGISTIEAISRLNICDMSGVDAANLISTRLMDFMKDNPAKKLALEYNSGIITPEYIEWELKTLKGIYHDIPFVNVFGREYPAYVIPGSDKVTYPFTSLTHTDNLLPIENEIDYKHYPWFNDFKKIVGPHIHYPNLYGYTNCGFILDSNDKVEGLISRPRTYKETVFTCHILQYELWTAYKKTNGLRLATLDDLPMRKEIHKKKTNTEVLLSGCNRSALNDVTIAVIDYNDRTEEYDIATATRTENVATYPNYFGFVPSGGFELFELENNQTQTVIQENFSIIGALFREYIEELFGDVDFGEPTGDDDLNRLFRNNKVRALRNGVKSGSYKFEFLGVDFDLITLRQTLAFVLRIDDENFFYDNEIKKNNENKFVKFTSLKNLEAMIQNEELPVLSETAATFSLLKNHHLFQEIISDSTV